MKDVKYFSDLAATNPDKCKEAINTKHTTYIDTSDCVHLGQGRINWTKSISKTIAIYRDAEVRTFEIVDYTSRPSDTAHDGKVILKDKENNKQYSVWSRDLKQGDIAKLFK